MSFTVPHFRPQPAREPAAIVRTIGNADVLWNRPVFKAPPLVVEPRKHDAALFTDDIRRGFRDRQS